MDSENVYGTSLPDSMIRKFSKNGKLKLNIAIDPIIPVPAMISNKSSTKNTAAESKKSNSDCLSSIDHEKGPQEVSKWIKTRSGCLKKGSMTMYDQFDFSNIEKKFI